MASKFIDIATPAEQIRIMKPGFEGTGLDDAFKTLLSMGWRKDEFAIAGSASLYLHSSTAMERGFSPLIARMPGDIDVLVTGDAMRHAMEIGKVTPSDIGKGYLISLHLPGGQGNKLDLTTHWPTDTGVKDARELRGMTNEINGIHVLSPDRVLHLKDVFNRVKDRPDLQTAATAHHRSTLGNYAPGAKLKLS